MKHLRKFEDYDLGPRFSDEEQLNNPQPDMPEEDFYPEPEPEDETECEPCGTEDGGKSMNFYSEPSEDDNPDEEDSEEEEEMKSRVWGDEQTVERISTFRQFEAKKAKPDFLDLDKDGNKKESMKKAAKEAKEDKKDDKKETKGLTKAQSKLPEGLRKAIEARKKK